VASLRSAEALPRSGEGALLVAVVVVEGAPLGVTLIGRGQELFDWRRVDHRRR
jgi:hypothetical protein